MKKNVVATTVLAKKKHKQFAPVAQWTERDVSTVKAGGSNPSWGT